MQITHRNNKVHRISPIICCEIDIPFQCTDICTAFGIKPGIGDKSYRFAFPYRSCSGTGFDYIYSDRREFFCNLEFLKWFERDSGRLFPVP
jgi:hypothetical protein